MTVSEEMKGVTDVLNAAADLLEKPGAWTQGAASRDVFGNPDGDAEIWPDAVCWCVWGAILNVTGETSIVGANQRTKSAAEALERHIGTNDVTTWNDASGRTQAEVVAALREAARQSSRSDGAGG